MKFSRLFASAGLAALALVPAAQAAPASPFGMWQTVEGDARFDVKACDGTADEICATLVWLRDDAHSPENLQLMNQLVVWDAKPTAANRWRGMVNYKGHVVKGSLTMLGVNSMKVTGCKFVLCETMEFERL
ncbi:hypothetical protein GCM10007989_26240 [Devosia pacifica]|uniref:DUF2147 domain-containing protein n=1 Tax=Devosia pacifica TaxID=1335967 RepID=A0A918S8L7_9HYPH|nr:DUF2147 domain-containing protein [Devosia pacifica]GHA29407.1 hypothetical protein GCM10007989_26240 [Devosia pacifica]